MGYIIYNSIKEDEFKILYNRINSFKPYLIDYLSKHSFKITNEADLVEILGLDFIYQNHKYNGNIGFLFDDIPHKPTFTFYLTKSFDKGSTRFFKRMNIEKGVELSYIEKNIQKILNEAINKYDGLKDDELTDTIKLNS